MKDLFKNDYGLIGETPIRFNKGVMILLALIYPVLSQFFSGIASVPVIIAYFARKGFDLTKEPTIDPFLLLTSVSFCILFYFLMVRVVEKRSFKTLGFNLNKKAIFEYILGFLIGIIMISIAGLIIVLSGNSTVEFVGFSPSLVPGFIFVIVAWIVQGASEEIMMRGYALPVLGKCINPPVAIFITSIYFSALHLLNNGIALLPLVNLFLFGVFAALYALYSKNLWGICALHSSWNFAQGNLWGFSVSGNDLIGNTIFKSSYESNTLINGGNFGPEGGIAVSLVLVVGILCILFLQQKKSKAIN